MSGLKLMPTRLEAATEEELSKKVETFIAGAEPGTRFIAKDENGVWTIYRTLEEELE